jgi:hypothetical protein
MVTAKSHGPLSKRIGSRQTVRPWTESTPMQRMKSKVKKLLTKLRSWRSASKREHGFAEENKEKNKTQKKKSSNEA